MQDSSVQKKTGLRRLKPFLILAFIFIILLPILISILLQFSFVQNWVADRVTSNLSNKLGTEVSVDEVSFSIRNGVVLENLLILNQEYDTLIYVGAASTDLTQNLTSLFNNKLGLRSIELGDVELNVKVAKGDSTSNLSKYFSVFGSGGASSSKPGSSFDLGIENAKLNNFKITTLDENKGRTLNVNVTEGMVTVDTLDFKNNHLSFKEIFFKNPEIYLTIEEHEQTIRTENVTESIDSIIVNNESLLEVGRIIIESGFIAIHDNRYKAKKYEIPSVDYNHLELDGVNLNSSEIKIVNNSTFLARINSFQLKEDKGFDIQELKVDQIHFDENRAELNGLYFETSESIIRDKIQFKFNDFSAFREFEKKVKLKVDFSRSVLAIRDLLFFFPDLYGSSFFKRNYQRKFNIEGKIRGTANNLSGNNVNLSIDDLLRYEGRFSTRNLTDINNSTISFKIQNLGTSIPNLRMLIPDFTPPQNFNLLGDISYTGRFNGSFFDFVSFGSLNTDIGNADLDLRMDLRGGVENAEYKGNLNLKSFDLGKWSGNKDFDQISFNAYIDNGRGLTLANAFADLSAEMTNFSFKDYTYQNVIFDGQIDKNKFVGKLTLDDPNVKFDFDGNLSFEDDIIDSDFTASVGKFNLKDINLTTEDAIVGGDFDVQLVGTGIDDFVGDATISKLILNINKEEYLFDSLSIESYPTSNGKRSVSLVSEEINANLEGKFNLTSIADHGFHYFHQYHPLWAKKLKIPNAKNLKDSQQLIFDVKIKDSKNYFTLAGVKDLQVFGTEITGEIDLRQAQLNSTLKTDSIYFKNNRINGLHYDIRNEKEIGAYSITTDSIWIKDRKFNPVKVTADINKDNVHLEIFTSELLDSIKRVELVADISPENDGFVFELSQNQIEMLGTDWEFSKGNRVFLGNKTIDIQDLKLTDGNRTLAVYDIEDVGVGVNIEKFDFLLVNQLINYDKIDFGGEGDLYFSNTNIFENGALKLDYNIPNFTLNGDSYGKLKLLASSKRKNEVEAVIRIFRKEDGQDIKAEVLYDFSSKDIIAELIADKFDLRLFEYIIPDGISKTQGYAQVDAKLVGSLDDPKLFGKASLHEGATEINYLGNYITFDNQELSLSEKYVELTGLEIQDRLGNTASFEGGLNHYFLGDFTIDATLTSNRFLSLDTDKKDNPLYYGQGLGSISLEMGGTFDSPDFLVNATTGAGANLNIPIESSQSDFDESFIKIVSRDDILSETVDTISSRAVEIEGVNFELNLTITPEAQFNLIFDERMNDVIKGKGRGDLRVFINRRGDFEVYGDYEVESGEYLFTALGIVAKPFTIKRGGLITWTGDPFNANLDIEAYYEGLRAPLDVFVSEYLIAQTSVAQEAKSRTDVDLTMKINGLLYAPEVSFDMNFPDVQGELKSYVESKLRTLRQNESELNDQVAGLILFGTFLPSNNGLGSNLVSSNSIISGGYNTLSEMIGSQLSFMLSDILDEAFTEEGFIQGIDFDIGFNKNSQIVAGQLANTGFIPDEIEVNLSPRLQNDRWGFDIGTNYVRANGGATANQTYFIGDFALEYYLSKDRKLKLRGYAKNDFDALLSQREQKFGVGLNFRTEFGSFAKLKAQMKKDIKATLKEGN